MPPKSSVAVLRTSPSTVRRDYNETMNLAGNREMPNPTADTVLKINISWHFFIPGSSTTLWQQDGFIRGTRQLHTTASRVLAHTLREAPEVAARRRRRQMAEEGRI